MVSAVRHRLAGFTGQVVSCSCGWSEPAVDWPRAGLRHALHVMDAFHVETGVRDRLREPAGR
jgi:hypothetical protein